MGFLLLPLCLLPQTLMPEEVSVTHLFLDRYPFISSFLFFVCVYSIAFYVPGGFISHLTWAISSTAQPYGVGMWAIQEKRNDTGDSLFRWQTDGRLDSRWLVPYHQLFIYRVKDSKPDLLTTLSIVSFVLKTQFPNFPTFPNSIHPGKLSQRIIMCLGNTELFRCKDTLSKVHRAVICPLGFPVPSGL